MNKNINIAKILKDVPRGTKLWSPLFGRCELVGVFTDKLAEGGTRTLIKTRPIEIYEPKLIHTDYACFHPDGQFEYWHYENGECILFPSKENQDWSTFKLPKKHKHFEAYQKVLVKSYDAENAKDIWTPSLYGCYVSESKKHCSIAGVWYKNDEILSYEGNESLVGKSVE